jgi:hypothetical protein
MIDLTWIYKCSTEVHAENEVERNTNISRCKLSIRNLPENVLIKNNCRNSEVVVEENRWGGGR